MIYLVWFSKYKCKLLWSFMFYNELQTILIIWVLELMHIVGILKVLNILIIIKSDIYFAYRYLKISSHHVEKMLYAVALFYMIMVLHKVVSWL